MSGIDEIQQRAETLFDLLEAKTIFEVIPEVVALSDACKKTKFWLTHSSEATEAYKDLNAEKTYNVLVNKIGYAPTSAHVRGSIILIVPVLAGKLIKETKEGGTSG